MSQSFIHQVRILSERFPFEVSILLEVAILYSSSQNSLRLCKCFSTFRRKSRNPLFIKSEFSPLTAGTAQSWTAVVAILYSSSQNSLVSNTSMTIRFSMVSVSRNPLFIKSEFSLVLLGVALSEIVWLSQSFIHQVRILSAPPQPLALHGLKYSFPQASVFQL